MQYQLLIVDDDRDIRTMLKDFFELSGYSVSLARTGLEALDQLKGNPDLILLDINMPEMDGIEVCKRIRNQVNVPIVFLTAKVEEQDRVKGLMAGGDDYIMKPFSMDELHARVIAHLRREERGRDKKALRTAGEFLINFYDRTVFIGEKELSFTKTEFDIIEFLCSNKGRIFDKETIYERLWGFDKDGDSAIITEHIRRIRSKFAKESEVSVIETVWGVGYRWVL
ncbi:MAG: response regulator transcription factor [Lachnospiraceae bacterium]|nr:response regulator transcription factor [Lachnospiraceae bacterium]